MCIFCRYSIIISSSSNNNNYYNNYYYYYYYILLLQLHLQQLVLLRLLLLFTSSTTPTTATTMYYLIYNTYYYNFMYNTYYYCYHTYYCCCYYYFIYYTYYCCCYYYFIYNTYRLILNLQHLLLILNLQHLLLILNLPTTPTTTTSSTTPTTTTSSTYNNYYCSFNCFYFNQLLRLSRRPLLCRLWPTCRRIDAALADGGKLAVAEARVAVRGVRFEVAAVLALAADTKSRQRQFNLEGSVTRGQFLTLPLGANFDPWGEAVPLLNFVPWGWSYLLGMKIFVCPSILLNSGECSPLGVNEGVNIHHRGQISPLGQGWSLEWASDVSPFEKISPNFYKWRLSYTLFCPVSNSF
jgi:hypothetical protein